MESWLKDWIDALRSGKYEQGIGRLYDSHNDSYCCLGVLGCTLGKTNDELNINNMGAEYISYRFLEKYMSKSIIMFLYDHNDGPRRLYSGEKWSFNQIADWLEANQNNLKNNIDPPH